MTVEFVPDHPPDVDREATARRVPPWALIAVIAAVTAIAVVVVLRRGADRGAPRAAPTGTSVSSSVVADQPLIGGFPLPVRSLDPDLQAVYRSATVADLRTVVRADSCRTVTAGAGPQRTAAAISRGLGDYRLSDYSQAIDQEHGLCVLTVRERDAANTTIAVLTVVAPSGAALRHHTEGVVSQGSATTGVTRIQYARYHSPDGWVVTLGTVGVDGKQPIFSTLVGVVTDQFVRW